MMLLHVKYNTFFNSAHPSRTRIAGPILVENLFSKVGEILLAEISHRDSLSHPLYGHFELVYGQINCIAFMLESMD